MAPTATILVCDAAQDVGGKVSMLGAGWNRVGSPHRPFNLAIVAMLDVPPEDAGNTHTVVVRLVNAETGEPIMLDEQSIRGQATLPPSEPGEYHPMLGVHAPLVLSWSGVSLPSGLYRFELSLEGQPDPLTSVSFVVDPEPEEEPR